MKKLNQKKLKFLSKSIFYTLTLLFITLTLINCDKDSIQDIDLEETLYNTIKTKKLKLSDIPEVEQFLTNKMGDNFFKSTDINGAIFDDDQVIELINDLGGGNYSFRFTYPDTPVGTFYNLIVQKDKKGEFKTPYVLKYKCNEESLEAYKANNFSMGHFKGKVGIHKYTDFFKEGSFFKTDPNCPPEYDEFGDPIPCDEPDVDGSGSNGGSGTSDGSTGDSSGGGSGDFNVCTVQLYIMNCGGSNGSSWHTYESCGGKWKDTVIADYMSDIVCAPDKSAILKAEEDCPECPNPTSTGVNYPSSVTLANSWFDYTLSSSQMNYLNQNQYVIDKIKLFFKINGNNINTQQVMKDALDTLIDNIPVVFNIDEDNIYQDISLDFTKISAEKKVSVVLKAIKNAVSNDEIDYFDIHDLFYNLPTVDVDVVAKVVVGEKLLDVRIIFGVYDNLRINDFPNNGTQLGPLKGVVGNYSINGYWWTMKFRSFGSTYGNGADALWVTVKQKGETDYENGNYLENYLGY